MFSACCGAVGTKLLSTSSNLAMVSFVALNLLALLLGGGAANVVASARGTPESRKAAAMVVKLSYQGDMASFAKNKDELLIKDDRDNNHYKHQWWASRVKNALLLDRDGDDAVSSVHCHSTTISRDTPEEEAAVSCFVTGNYDNEKSKDKAGNDGAHSNSKLCATVWIDEALEHVSVEASLASSASASFAQMQEDLVQLALALDADEQGTWTITSPMAPPRIVEEETSLYNVVLTNPSLKHKKRVLRSGHVSIWTYVTVQGEGGGQNDPVEAVFLHDTLRFTTLAAASVAQAEAMVHPAMMAHRDPSRVLLISDMPLAPLRELLKYSATTLDHVDVVGASNAVVRDVLYGRYGFNEVLLRADKKVAPDELVSLIDAPRGVYHWVREEMARRGISSLEAIDPTVSFHDDLFWPCHNDTDKYPVETPEQLEERTAWLSSLCENDAFARQNKRLGMDWERQLFCMERYYSLDDVNAAKGGDISSLGSTIVDQDVNGNDVTDNHGDGSKDKETDEAPDVAKQLSYDVIVVDIPYYDQNSLTFTWLHRHLMALNAKNDDFLLVVSAGSAPELRSDSNNNKSSSHKNVARDMFLRQLTRPTSRGGLAYQYATVYDEPLAAPLSTAFALAFQWDNGDANTRFYRTNSAAFDMDLLDRLVPYTGAGKPPTVLYDGPTHVGQYQLPSRLWENWYCHSSPGRDLPGCTLFRNWMFDPTRHHKNVEPRMHPIKGRSLFVVDDAIPKNHFVNFDDVIHSLHLDATEWDSLVNFVERYPDAALYRALRDFFAIYGFEVKSHAITGWAVSSSSTNTFSNHACTDGERTIGGPDAFVGPGEDGFYTRFSPVASRRPRIASYVTMTKRDLVPGDEVQVNYQALRTDFTEHAYFDMFLTEMCSSGVGMVPVRQDATNRTGLVGNDGDDMDDGMVDVHVEKEDSEIQTSSSSLGEISSGGAVGGGGPLTPTLEAAMT